VLGFLIPIIATAYISTGPSYDKSWYWQNPAPQGNPLYAESFVDAANGWAVGGGGVILHTNDGGRVWAEQDAPTQRNLRGLDMADLSSGWTVGDTGYILRTVNGGSSWTTQTAPVVSILRAVSAATNTTAWVVGDGGVILKTTNGGGSWTQQSSSSTAILYGVSAFDANTAYACGAGGVVLKTTNGGTNWTTVASGTTTQLNAVVAVSPTQFWVVGNNGLIRVSGNGGTSWTTQTSSSTQNLSAIAAASPTTLWVAGAAGSLLGTTNSGTTWTLQNNNGSALYAIAAGSSSAAYASGAAGYMVATSNGGSTWDTEYTRTAQQLNAVFFSSDTTGWGVGNAGAIMRTTDGGDSWAVQQSGTTNLLAVCFADANTGWVVGAAGRIIKTTDGGTTWVAQTSGTTNALNGVWFTSPTNGVAVGAGGTILRTTNGGTTWAAVNAGTTQGLYAVRFSGTSVGWAVGNGGVIRRSLDGGATWTTQASGTTQRLVSVSCVNTQVAFASGLNGTVRKTSNGGTTAWTGLTSGTNQSINSISMTSATTGWYVANTGLVFRTTDGSTWTQQVSGTTSNLLGVWARNSTTAWTVGAAGVTRRTKDGVNWSSIVYGTQNALYAISMDDTSTGWAVGATGAVVRTADGGASWIVQSPGTANNLFGVSALSPQSVVAVGAAGTAVTSADGGTTWTVRTSGTTNQLNALAFPTTTGWAVGNAGTIIKSSNSGATWATQRPPNGTPNLLGVHFRSNTLGWAVGAAGAILKTTNGGTSWTTQTSRTTNQLNAVYFSSDTTGYAVGNVGTVLRTANGGTTWTTVTDGIGTTENLFAVSSANTTNVVLAGAAGTVRRSKDGGLSWITQMPGTSNDLQALSVLAPSEQWIAGTNGTILKTADQTVPVTTIGLDPNAPDGATGIWYVSTPLISLTTSKPGITYYSWVSATGPFTTYSAPITGLEGNRTIYYYSIDTASISETVKSTSIKTDVSLPTASTLVTVTSVTTSTADVSWSAATDAVSGVSGYEVYLNGGTVPVASTMTTAAALVGLVPNTVNAVTVVTVDNAGNRSPVSLPAYAITDPLYTGPPITTTVVTPSIPTGGDDWYDVAPIITLSSSRPGTVFYSWTSAVGPFSTYSAPFSAIEGIQTLRYYSVDAMSNAEVVRSLPIKTDATLPSASAQVVVSAMTTSTAEVEWSPGDDTISGVSGYEVYVDGALAASTPSTGTLLAGLTPGTDHAFTVVTVDVAGNHSIQSLPALGTTDALDTTPPTTVLTVDPQPLAGSGGWYVTTPTVAMTTLPNTVQAVVYYSWDDAAGPFTSYATTITPPSNSATLYFSAHDVAGVRTDEATRQVSFLTDSAAPTAPSVAASATSYSSVRLTWPGVVPTPSGTAYYSVYKNGSLLTTVIDPFIDVVGLSQGTAYSFVVYTVNGAGAVSAGSEVANVVTPTALLPSPPAVVYAKSPSGFYALVNWSAATVEVPGNVNYRVWRSENGVDFSAVGTTTAGVDDTTFIDSTLTASTRYWYAVTTIDPRGESDRSSTAAADWQSILTTTAGPQRVTGLTAVEASASVALSWQVSPNLATVGYRVTRADASLATPTVITLTPPGRTVTTIFDLTVQNDQPYYYSVAAIDASGVVGSPSLEILARPHSLPVDPSPHTTGSEASACICHASHTASAPSRTGGSNKLIRFPGNPADSMCVSCHPGTTARAEFSDPLAKSRHNLETTPTAAAPFTCLSCHRAVTGLNEPAANLMRVNGTWVCMEVTGTPAGNGFCYSCHGAGSTLPRGDLSVFEGSAHATVSAPATGAGIKCDACHESHSSRNEHLNKYSGYMVCMQCHTSTTADAGSPDLWSKLTLSSDTDSGHRILPQDQTGGSAMACQNCHNTHAVTKASPLVDPHDPAPDSWSSADQKSFCFRCHDGEALPTNAETAPWADAVLASGAATSVADIGLAYNLNIHGAAAEITSATTNAFLRPSMGYRYDTELQCDACHDPHASVNSFALRQDVSSADGSRVIKGVVVAPVPGGGYDLRFFCNTCHVFDPATHDIASMANTSTVNFPTDCTAAGCHRHMNEAGTQGIPGL
jgi:predicted CXXCH cytochrome family protein